ncbi:GATA transcription factor 15-like [Brachypodium distachyon]|uniref:GATA transcription factor 15-like n=1 Tax=Brachypodium distachyon TaxID=15368 RepID=UPI0005300B39|nr:GATA transcription factor 15-like [Brachypodium distachyon]|eukprot:XP_010233206.1 GATA transcription factor 15-like [Brachypodium distachyon]
MHGEIRHRQARRASADDDMDVDDVGQPPPANLVSALAVPDDPLDDGIMDAEKINGFIGFGAVEGAWFDEFCGGSMDMSTRAGVDFLEMLLDGESSSSAALAADAAATMNVSPSLSSSDDDDEWMDPSSESEDDAADEHWLPTESSSKNTSATTGSGKKRRLPRQQQQQSTAATGQRKPQQTEPTAVVEGGGGNKQGGYWCRGCSKVETPLWRAGPEGPKTLCNACGLRYKNSLAAMAAPQTTTTTATKRLALPAKPRGRSSKSNKNRSATVVRKKRT